MTKTKGLDLTHGTIWKGLAAFVIPIILGSLIQQLYTTVDAVIVGQFLGKEGLAAIDSVGTLFKFPINFLSGLSAGATIIVSRFVGSKDHHNLECTIQSAYSIALTLGLVFSVGGVLLSPVLLDVMAVPADIYNMTLVYVRIYFAGLWTMTLYNMLSGVLRAFGDSKSPLYILILCCVINIAGDLLLVGVFKMGVAGAAIATVAAQIVSAVLALRVLSKKYVTSQTKIWKIHFCKEHCRQLLRTGFPLALQSIFFPIANSIIQANVNMMNTDNIAAWAVCGKLEMLIWLISDSMSPALSTFVSQNMGANKKERITKGVLLGAAASAAAIAIISILLVFLTGPLVHLFVGAEDVKLLQPLVVKYMMMMVPFYIFYSFAESFSGACCGLGDTLRPMITTLICTCGLRVACIIFLLPLSRSMETIVWIYIVSWIVTGAAFIIMFLCKRRKMFKKPVVNNQN